MGTYCSSYDVEYFLLYVCIEKGYKDKFYIDIILIKSFGEKDMQSKQLKLYGQYLRFDGSETFDATFVEMNLD